MTYREGAEEERPRCIPFGALSSGSRERLCLALYHREPLLLADWERLPESHWAWALLGAAGLGLAVFALLHRFGDLSVSPRSPILGGLLAGAGLSAALWGPPVFRALRGINALPRGVFLLPFDLVDTRSDALWIYPLARLERAQREGDGKIRLEFQGGAVYRLPGTMSGGELLEQIRRAQQKIHERLARGDEEALRHADPFLPERGRWPTDALPQAPPSLPWGRWLGPALAVGLALGQILAPLVYRASDARGLALAVRDADDDALLRYVQRQGPASDEADELRWRLAREQRESGGLFRYLRTGLRHRDEADRLLVEQLQAKLSVPELLRYLESGGKERDWADQMLLQLALKEGTEVALRAYVDRGGKAKAEVERVLLPRLLIDQAARGKNLTLLRLMASAPEQLSPKQRIDRGELSEAMRAEALAALATLRERELQLLRGQLASAPEATRLLLKLVETRSNLWASVPLSFSVTREDLSGKKKVLRPVRYDEDELWEPIEGALRAALPSYLIQIARTPAEDRVEVVFDAFYGENAWFTFVGKLMITAGGKSMELPFQSYCQPAYRSRTLQVLRNALQAALLGQPEDCAAR